MLEFQIPELLRMPLQELCLHTKLLAPINCPVVDFLMKAPDPPPALIVKNALQMLKTIDAMDPWEDLTELGYHLTELPVEPHLGKMVLCAVKSLGLHPLLSVCLIFTCPACASHTPLDPMAVYGLGSSAASMWTAHYLLLNSCFSQPWNPPKSHPLSRGTCYFPCLAILLTNSSFKCFDLSLSSGFVRARGGADIRGVNTNSENWAVVKAALVAGMYPNLVHVDRENLVLTAPKEKKVRFHPTSVLSQPQYKKIPPVNSQTAAVQALPTDWLIYDEMTRAHRIANIRCCSVVTPVTVALFCGSARLPSNALQASSSHQGDRVSSDSSDSEMEDRTTSNVALKLDEWLHL
ncbi:YTDC2 helicase, partial [Chaetops frenatus]|nr:YTDC2 helicase [Chaetops frenatus]